MPVFSSFYSLGNSGQVGSFISGGGAQSSTPPRLMEVVGVAPKGAQLIEAGLSTEVVETWLRPGC